MSTIQQNPNNQLASNNNEIPDWFYFAFGMMLVIFSSFKPQQQNLNNHNSTPNEIMIHEKEESILTESNQDFKDVEVLLESSQGETVYGENQIQSANFKFQYSLK